jgi:hypothetical protein
MDVHIPTDDGYWVSENFCRLAEIINDFNPHLELRWIPPTSRESKDERANPYCIVDTAGNYIVMFASERDTPEQILAKLIDIDNTNGDVLRRLEAQNDAAKIFELKKQRELMDAASEVAAFMIRSPLNYLKVKIGEDLVKLDDERRRVK